ncbi:MAG: His/Gly/Thr/Pro-type tRNA ligase C-terminal domain-containing protein, partial [Actinomycetota bacterium]|nr:His/Gly/Thr/Pro-type tRNA ligase C-terminal domain-containing protein [Actinomycetota bacterium]
KALQMGTSHELGQNFAKSFGVQFTSAQGRLEYVWQTSWGASTRMVGGLIMCHGDDVGLRIPPRLAPVQIVVMVVKDGPGVTEAAAQLVSDLTAAGLRCDIDARTDTPFGRRAIDRELKGVPVRVEVGPRELAEGNATLVRRIPGIRGAVALTALVSAATQALGEDQDALYAEALTRREGATADVQTIAEALQATATGWARIDWAVLGAEGEAALAEQAVSVRCLLSADGGVPKSEDEPGLVAVLGRSY